MTVHKHHTLNTLWGNGSRSSCITDFSIKGLEWSAIYTGIRATGIHTIGNCQDMMMKTNPAPKGNE
jgi:hypothetical protein